MASLLQQSRSPINRLVSLAALMTGFLWNTPARTAPEDEAECEDPILCEGTDLADLDLEGLLDFEAGRRTVTGIHHTHPKGEMMVEYHYGVHFMEGSRDGIERVSDADVLAAFPVTPTQMTTHMHMLHVMYAPTQNLTLMVRLMALERSMVHITRMGAAFTTTAAGLGDSRLSAMLTVWEGGGHQIHSTLGLTVPTGSVDERDDTPAQAQAKLPYPMQLGTGSIGLSLGAAYLGVGGDVGWGVFAASNQPMHENGAGWRAGARYDGGVWLSYEVLGVLVPWLRLAGHRMTDIHGADPDLNPNMVPTARTDLRSGFRLDGTFGLGIQGPIDSAVEGARADINLTLPLLQALDGPQLELDWGLGARVKWSFDVGP